MNAAYEKVFSQFNCAEIISTLTGIKRGFEKECLRVNKQEQLAMTPHPIKLGSNLTHPMITTDFSESLLELITPPTKNIYILFNTLLELHQYTYSALTDEFLWAFSMPCHLPADNLIPIAKYGDSNLGLLKYYYRVGLGHRYGKRMQMIAGVHYNFSLPDKFWQTWYEMQGGEKIAEARGSEKDFISESYLGMIRNALRYSWILPLLFGASPALTSSFLENALDLQPAKKNGYFLPYATSLRLSDLGYHNKNKPLVEISYNSFPEFIQTMHNAVHTEDPEFAKIGVKVGGEYRQLSASVLQVEDEHYAMLRPKRVSGHSERMLAALMKDGIEYVEVRALDLDPFSPLGVEPETVYILDAFLIFCLLLDSPKISPEEKVNIAYNQKKILKEGRKPGLELLGLDGEKHLLQDLSNDIMEMMAVVAEVLDKTYKVNNFSNAIAKARSLLADFTQLPSTRILQEMENNQESFCELASRWSHIHQDTIKKQKFEQSKMDYYQQLANKSLQEQALMEEKSFNKESFDDYLQKFLET